MARKRGQDRKKVMVLNDMKDGRLRVRRRGMIWRTDGCRVDRKRVMVLSDIKHCSLYSEMKRNDIKDCRLLREMKRDAEQSTHWRSEIS